MDYNGNYSAIEVNGMESETPFKKVIDWGKRKFDWPGLMYDVALSLLYIGCVYQAYLYDAKTRTGEIQIYLLVYILFAFLIRSPMGLIVMNLASMLSLYWIFLQAPFKVFVGYFDFQPLIGIVGTLLALIGQGVIMYVIRLIQRKYLTKRLHLIIWIGIALALSIILTVYVSKVPYTPLPK